MHFAAKAAGSSIVALLSAFRRDGGSCSSDGLRHRYASSYADPKGLYELAWTMHVSVGVPDRLERAEELYEEALRHSPSQRLRSLIERKIASCRKRE